MEKQRLEYFDQMKGVAIFLMIIGHVLIFTFGINGSPLNSILVSNMPIFFYVSGFFSYKNISNKESYLKNLSKKCARLLPPWIVFTIIMSFVRNEDIIGVACEFYWFFYVLFVLSILMICLEYVLFRHFANKFIYIGAVVSLPVIFAVLHILGFSMQHIPLFHFAMYALSFNLGWLCRKYDRLNQFLLQNQVVALIAFIIFTTYIFHVLPANNYVSSIAGICGIIFIQSSLYRLSSSSKAKGLKTLSKVGSSTLAIYVLNNFMLPDLRGGVIVSNLDQFSLFLTSAILATVVIACCMIVETIFHSNKYLSKIL